MKTSKKDLDNFKEFCRYYYELWHLNGWKIYYSHKKLENAYAMCSIDLTGRLVEIILADDWGDYPVIPANLQQVAKHEMAHVILGRMDACGKSRYVSDTELIEANEEAVRILEGLLP